MIVERDCHRAKSSNEGSALPEEVHRSVRDLESAMHAAHGARPDNEC